VYPHRVLSRPFSATRKLPHSSEFPGSTHTKCFRATAVIRGHPQTTLSSCMDCHRSSLLNHEFPLPRFYPGHTTGSTNSAWGEHWTTLHYWTPREIAATFRQYRDSTVTANDKSQPVTSWAMIDRICGMITQEPPATLESHVRRIFDLGISLAHGFSMSSQPPPSDAHSSIRVFENVVFGEPDYLLRNRYTGQVTGIYEAKSPWNVGPSEIDDVITS